jgi:hypothetical protein
LWQQLNVGSIEPFWSILLVLTFNSSSELGEQSSKKVLYTNPVKDADPEIISKL